MAAASITGEQFASAEKYRPFNIIDDVPYKHVNGTPIPASILVPKDLNPGKYPILVRWHGGGFGTGHRLFAPWYGQWTLDLALKHSAVSITPDYRLIPSSAGLDILSDARDFYTWLFSPNNVTQYLPPEIVPDLSSVLVTGESAGGWHAIQAGLLQPAKITAIIAHYPMIDLRSPHYTQAYHKDLLTPPAEQQDPSLLSAYIASLRGDDIITSRSSEEAQNQTLTLYQQGLYPKYFGTHSSLYPLEMLSTSSPTTTSTYPPIWLLHGTGDTIVPCESSTKFADALLSKFPSMAKDRRLHLTLREGEDHGFDLHDAVSGEPASLTGTEWVREGVEFVERFWPNVRRE